VFDDDKKIGRFLGLSEEFVEMVCEEDIEGPESVPPELLS